MNRRRVVSGLLGALVALALVGVTQAEAQSAAQFVGKWTITFAPPAGAPGGAAGAGGPPPGAGGGGGFGGGGGGGFRGGPTVVEVTQTGGTLAATMTGGFGFGGGGGGQGGAGGQGAAPQPRPISDVKVVDGALVLSYTQTMGQSGQSTPVTLKLTPDGAGMKVEQDLGNGRVRTGTAVKE